MDYLVIKAIIWIFFITSAILEVNYKKKYGELDKRARKQAILGIFLIVTTIFDEGYENKNTIYDSINSIVGIYSLSDV